MSDPSPVRRRSIGIVFSDGGLLAQPRCARPAPAGTAEEVAAVMQVPTARRRIAETLLSTEYGSDGVQRRGALELRPDGEDGQPLRAAPAR